MNSMGVETLGPLSESPDDSWRTEAVVRGSKAIGSGTLGSTHRGERSTGSRAVATGLSHFHIIQGWWIQQFTS
jgi:hypothetical protein